MYFKIITKKKKNTMYIEAKGYTKEKIKILIEEIHPEIMIKEIIEIDDFRKK